jgi:hypothetical protein
MTKHTDTYEDARKMGEMQMIPFTFAEKNRPGALALFQTGSATKIKHIRNIASVSRSMDVKAEKSSDRQSEYCRSSGVDAKSNSDGCASLSSAEASLQKGTTSLLAVATPSLIPSMEIMPDIRALALTFARAGDTGSFKELVKSHARTDLASSCDRYGCTCLMWAAGGGHLEMCKVLALRVAFNSPSLIFVARAVCWQV